MTIVSPVSTKDLHLRRLSQTASLRCMRPYREGHGAVRPVQGATVNREMADLRCMFNFAIERKYLSENPANRVKPFDERRERPAKRMLEL
jgi:hypothetical protein